MMITRDRPTRYTLLADGRIVPSSAVNERTEWRISWFCLPDLCSAPAGLCPCCSTTDGHDPGDEDR